MISRGIGEGAVIENHAAGEHFGIARERDMHA